MSFGQLVSILKARWRLLGVIVLVALATTIILSLVLPKKYTATASVVIDGKSPDPISGTSLQGILMANYMATQIDILMSERVTNKVIKNLRLDQVQVLREQWQDEGEGQGLFTAWLAELLLKNLEIRPARESSVINISYTGAHPDFAAALANAYVQAYVETTLELRVEPARQYSRLFEDQVKQAREKLEVHQTTLSNFQKSKGLIDSDQRLDVETMRLNELSAQLVGLQSQTADSNSRKNQAGPNSPDVLANPLVSSLRADLSRQEARLKELQAKLGSAHPQVTELVANISELKSRIDLETRSVNTSVGVNSSINIQRESQVRAALEKQREKVLKLKEIRDEAAVHVRDVENAQRTYDAMQTRLTQMSLESQTNQTNVSVLKVASPPVDPSSPKLLLNTVLALILGSAFAAAVALVAELLDRRIRSEEDVKADLGVGLLGVLPEVQNSNSGTKGSSGMLAQIVSPSKRLGLSSN